MFVCVRERKREIFFFFFFFWGGEKITHCVVKSLSAADRRNGASPRATNPRFPPLPQCLAARTGKVKVVKPPLSLTQSHGLAAEHTNYQGPYNHIRTCVTAYTAYNHIRTCVTPYTAYTNPCFHTRALSRPSCFALIIFMMRYRNVGELEK